MNCSPASTPRWPPASTESDLIIDPGLGFAKTAQHNWALLHALPDLVATGIPVLVGASRKRFLGTLLADRDRAPRPARRPGDRHRGDLGAGRACTEPGASGSMMCAPASTR